MGGVWERVIRSIRKILTALLGQQLVNEEMLGTLMAEVQGILNSRPLTPVSSDPKDLEPLTPNHLLLLRANPNLPPGVFAKEDTHCKRRWRQVQYMSDIFWKRWLKEYLPTLQLRQKWCNPRRCFAVNEFFLLWMEMFIAANGLWPEFFKFIAVRMDTSDLQKFVQTPQHSLDLFQNCASLSMMDSKSVTNWINYLREFAFREL